MFSVLSEISIDANVDSFLDKNIGQTVGNIQNNLIKRKTSQKNHYYALLNFFVFFCIIDKHLLIN